MKILAIRGKNLASLDGAFDIDFTAEPLKSAGIFAITGQTGAGKSTILDALCLALFDNVPRLNKAELIRKEDLESQHDKISPQDCRNILRRGTGEGYAEVDFIALNGDYYRSRWMVKRARGKPDGSLQKTEMALENLTHGVQEQGTKKDLLTKVTSIIGLTFDQFTRAVLLAQGDFANFLKARQNEKAELLEKLTGTEIYSKISILIYHKAAEAKKSLELIQQRIKDVRLLNDEELEAFNQEKLLLEKEIAPLNLCKTGIEKKLDWLKQEEQLKGEIIKADSELKTVREKITRAAPRYEYMSLIDVSREIRDSYTDLTNRQAHAEKLNSQIRSGNEELKLLAEKYGIIEKELQTAKTVAEETEEKYNRLKPELAKAKELDFKIGAIREKLTDSNKAIETYREQINKTDQNISSLKDEEKEIKQKQDKRSAWLAEHTGYETIVPKADYVNSLINICYASKKQHHAISTSLDLSKAVLSTHTDQLEQYEKEAERLNKLLPAEILHLRSGLEEGKPCPVCGSTHHPSREQTGQQDRIDERKLEAEKKRIADAIAQTKDKIEKTKKGITGYEVHIQNFQTQYENTYNELKELLRTIPRWEADFKAGSLQEKLTAVISQWNKSKQQADLYNQRLGHIAVKLEAENKNLENIKIRLKEKEGLHKSVQSESDGYISQRKQLLENRRVEEVEEYYSGLKQQHTRQYEHLRSGKDKIEKEKSVIEGTLSQLKKDNASNDEQVTKLNAEVRHWLNSGKHQISPDLLSDLIARPQEWISQEKSYLNDLKSQELICKTTLTERNGRLITHRESEHKPNDGETKEELSQQLTELSDKTVIISKRLTEIGVSLLAHERGKEQIRIFEKELNEKTELYNNWAKLNDLLGSASGNKFKTIAQGYTLDVLLSYANKHLEELTQRYKLEKIAGTLALQVIDNDMLGEIRTVHSLSGGESFLISLALALGLSSLSSNRMKIESLFIDEGFGALDADTLSIAMDALDNLQTQGRKIGVISHVEEMKERITTQIQVVKAANGRSYIKIVG